MNGVIDKVTFGDVAWWMDVTCVYISLHLNRCTFSHKLPIWMDNSELVLAYL